MAKVQRTRATLRRQIERLRASNDRAEASIATELANRPSIASAWRAAFGKTLSAHSGHQPKTKSA